MFVRGIGRRSVGTALQTSAFTNMSSTYQELNFVPSYPALPYIKHVGQGSGGYTRHLANDVRKWVATFSKTGS